MEEWKILAETSWYVMAIATAVTSAYTYWLAERARWLTRLYEKFFESDNLKQVRDLLDTDDNTSLLKKVK